MEPRTKKVTQKHPRHDAGPTPPLEMEFTESKHQERFKCLQKLKLGQSHYIDWDSLGEIILVDEVREFVDVGG